MRPRSYQVFYNHKLSRLNYVDDGSGLSNENSMQDQDDWTTIMQTAVGGGGNWDNDIGDFEFYYYRDV